MPFSMQELLDELRVARTFRADKPWGHEIVITCEHFILKVITIEEGHRTSLQHHEVKDEVIFIADGTGHVEIDSEPQGGVMRPSMPICPEAKS